MIENLIYITNKNTDALIDILFGFYLDGDAIDRQQIERELIDLGTKHQLGGSNELVQKLRKLAADRGL
ncbi:hypothetical protein NIES37_15710 [Tolypothrix tenuis PCC 7101]|uniref:Uncharacterized protein n=1 Tax=Tolypothrix tenuis PCC 7101 TaxID=231146 RepID=A0A1Z4MVZ6_9CYAN|nr:hypothetical protein [Aulosira sp. FACHB-113]BAY97627.1 hypothetical protein NIES37_15710 [Tolypothrix tenuis PCC 7101]BAZ71865.1 hypothetical protein NIES50_04120 [Aulosira laxa NIES-50]